MEEFSLLIGGKAGDGIRRAGNLIGRIFNKAGYYIFVHDDYPSLIRGGQNFSVIRVSEKRIYSHHNDLDVIIALDSETIEDHQKNLNSKGVLVYDKKLETKVKNALSLPLTEMIEEIKGIPIMRNSVTIGALCYLFKVPTKIAEDIMKEVYGKHADPNIKLLHMGYKHAEKNIKRIKEIKVKKSDKKLFTANETIALGAVKAGLKLYVAYPMTPATSILHFLTNHREDLDMRVVQAENEISVIMMGLGAAYAGTRTMIGSSGGGFALMQEGVSMAGMSETPLVIVESQRAGPSSGVPTYTAQADLRFVLHSGHGDFPRIVIAPSDIEEAFYKGGEAVNLAWKFQVPVLVLLDKTLSESAVNVKLDEKKIKYEEAKITKPNKDYKRYEYTKDGISPLSFPGTESIVKATSYEHDEFGITTENPEEIKKMQEKRWKKIDEMVKELKKRKTVDVYGKGKNLVITWGSSKGPVIDAVDMLDKDVRVLSIIYMEPFPVWEVLPLIEKADKVVCVEGNIAGQLAGLVREKTGFEIKDKILKYDSRPFDPIELSKKFKKVFK
jgi:2-oxoglutarate ferredoxin oxidoreductase subunit alpha